MIARYFHILRNLPGILDRIERELGSKATKASVDTLRFTVTKKADVEFVVNLSGIINERFAERPTHADIVLVKEEIGLRIDGLEKEVETLAFNSVLAEFDADMAATKAEIEALDAVKTGEPNLLSPLELRAVPTGHYLHDLAEQIDAASADFVGGKNDTATFVKTSEVTEPLTIKVKAPKKPRAPKGGGK
ncbi:MAG: hypothetical protein ACT6QM_05915 [Brevundimonas mediterranea]|uniref:hypothetical protein n=1 Tax=Brevundimonas mediterranea TaxID=74329 RepID=UPI004034B745